LRYSLFQKGYKKKDVIPNENKFFSILLKLTNNTINNALKNHNNMQELYEMSLAGLEKRTNENLIRIE